MRKCDDKLKPLNVEKLEEIGGFCYMCINEDCWFLDCDYCCECLGAEREYGKRSRNKGNAVQFFLEIEARSYNFLANYDMNSLKGICKHIKGRTSKQ